MRFALVDIRALSGAGEPRPAGSPVTAQSPRAPVKAGIPPFQNKAVMIFSPHVVTVTVSRVPCSGLVSARGLGKGRFLFPSPSSFSFLKINFKTFF